MESRREGGRERGYLDFQVCCKCNKTKDRRERGRETKERKRRETKERERGERKGGEREEKGVG